MHSASHVQFGLGFANMALTSLQANNLRGWYCEVLCQLEDYLDPVSFGQVKQSLDELWYANREKYTWMMMLANRYCNDTGFRHRVNQEWDELKDLCPFAMRSAV
jgi:hypothetical protein